MVKPIEPKRKYLKFGHGGMEMIVSGHKTRTYRYNDEKGLRVGDEIDLIDKHRGHAFATAKITGVQEKKIMDLTDEDLRGQDQCKTAKELLNAMARFYNRTMTRSDILKIIDFEITNLYQKYVRH